MVLTSQAAHQALAELRDPAVLSPAPGPALSASTEQPLDRLAEWHSSLTMVCRQTQLLNSLLFCRNLFPNFTFLLAAKKDWYSSAQARLASVQDSVFLAGLECACKLWEMGQSLSSSQKPVIHLD